MTLDVRLEQRMLDDMVNVQTSQTDRKAISKVRQFSQAEIESLPLFANSLQSQLGLRAAFSQLDEREMAFLHLLALHQDPVSIDFFHSLYGVTPRGRYGVTFTQAYGDLFKRVRQRLIRQGVLLWAEIAYGDSKLERYRFALPRVVVEHLPPLITASRPLTEQPSQPATPFRPHLLDLIKRKGSTYADISLRGGYLLVNGQPFSREAWQAWQDRHWWQSVMQTLYGKANDIEVLPTGIGQKTDAFTQLIVYGLAQLPEDHWVKPDAFALLLELQPYAEPLPPLANVFEMGWRYGRLEQTTLDGEVYYRLAQWPDWQQQPIDYLKAQQKGVILDLEKIPLGALSILNQVGDLFVERQQLWLKPNIPRLAQNRHHLQAHSLNEWLKANCAAFGEAFQRLDEQWGRLLVHEGLLVARVNDLSLRVALEKQFANEPVLFFAEGWLAFPQRLQRAVESAVQRNGHVIKREGKDARKN